MRGIRLLSTTMLAFCTLFGGGAASGESIFDAQPLDDTELAAARGGFSLPNGMTIDFGVMVTTIVDGVRVLETQLRVAGDGVRTSVVQAVGTQIEQIDTQVDVVVSNSGGGGTSVQGSTGTTTTADTTVVPAVPPVTPPPTSSSANSGSSVTDNLGSATGGGTIGNQLVSVSPDGGVTANLGSVSVSTGADGSPQINVNQVAVDSATTGSMANAGSGAVTGNGAGTGGTSTATPAPTVSQPSANPGYVVTAGTGDPGTKGLSASAILPQLLIEHEIGRQISSLIINTGDGRVIENHLSIDLNIGNAQPYSIGSLGLRVQSLGVDAAIWRGSGG